MTSEQALRAVQQALADHGLPGGVGLVSKTRTFIIALGTNGGRQAAPAVTALLTAMGLECAAVDRLGILHARCPGKLLPAPVPVVRISSADCCSAAEAGAVMAARRCNGPCRRVLPVAEFSWRNQAKNWRMPQCVPCDRARQRARLRQPT